MTLTTDIDTISKMAREALDWESSLTREVRMRHVAERLSSLKAWVAKLEADNESLREQIVTLNHLIKERLEDGRH